MANIKSQIKRNRQNEKARKRNKGVRSSLKTDLKRFRTAVEEGDKEAAEQAFRTATKSLDQAASKNVLHANNAANKKSKMAKKLHAM